MAQAVCGHIDHVAEEAPEWHLEYQLVWVVPEQLWSSMSGF